MDNLFLAKILKENARLIIPGFGAFLRKEGVSTGLVFSPFLKKDDGVLSGLLCEEYGVTNFDGESMIAEWVQHIREALVAHGKYHIESVGLLVLDANGAITMVEEPVKKPAPVVQAVAQPVVTPVQPTVAAAPVQPRPLVQPEPVVSVQPESVASVMPAQPTIAKQIVEQIQQTPSRPLVSPVQPQQVAPRVAPRPVGMPQQGVQNQGMPPRPAMQGSPNMQQRPQGVGAPQQQTMPLGAPMGAQTHQRQQGPGGQQQNHGTPQQGQQQRPGAPRQGQRQPQKPKGKKYSSTEIWLVVAIVAALVVVAIIIWSLLVLSPKEEYYPVETVTDSTTMVDTLTVEEIPAK